jgi:hypothetical protein
VERAANSSEFVALSQGKILTMHCRLKEAERCFLRGAEEGSCDSMYQLHEMCTTVKGMVNEKLAIEWLLSAAAAGHSKACETLGTYCVLRDEQLARYWLSKVPGSPLAEMAVEKLGKEKHVSKDEWSARISAAIAKIPIASPAKVAAK